MVWRFPLLPLLLGVERSSLSAERERGLTAGAVLTLLTLGREDEEPVEAPSVRILRSAWDIFLKAESSDGGFFLSFFVSCSFNNLSSALFALLRLDGVTWKEGCGALPKPSELARSDCTNESPRKELSALLKLLMRSDCANESPRKGLSTLKKSCELDVKGASNPPSLSELVAKSSLTSPLLLVVLNGSSAFVSFCWPKASSPNGSSSDSFGLSSSKANGSVLAVACCSPKASAWNEVSSDC
mmetsp:Transcript_43793/g.105642  ORF Transcript_43793/g.105642 Transcript_43793/m.105642 type:complete len:242 (-) Transcript_43793:630-1355(-)